ncbi:MAG: hypothetical protein COB61_005660 [Thiotrichales bacterium]|nr:hypothetical protein [Thiotrichales bacterium]
MKKYYFLLFILIVLFSVAYYKIHLKNSYEDAYVSETENTIVSREDIEKNLETYNKQVVQLQKKRNQQVTNQTIESKKLEESYIQKLFDFVSPQVKKIEFYGKLVDQNGEAIPNVKVRYSALRGALSSGTGTGYATTNELGVFFIGDAKGNGLLIESFIKIGYQLPSFIVFRNNKSEGSLNDSWSDYTQSSPYVFTAWKVDRYPKVLHDSELLGFLPDNRRYTVNFFAEDINNEGDNEGELRIKFYRRNGRWELVIEAIDGGLVEALDEYKNMAPIDGYKKEFQYRGKENFPSSLHKHFYFFSSSRNLFGLLKMEIIPYYNRKFSSISVEYVFNLEQGRNLTVKQ